MASSKKSPSQKSTSDFIESMKQGLRKDSEEQQAAEDVRSEKGQKLTAEEIDEVKGS